MKPARGAPPPAMGECVHAAEQPAHGPRPNGGHDGDLGSLAGDLLLGAAAGLDLPRSRAGLPAIGSDGSLREVLTSSNKRMRSPSTA